MIHTTLKGADEYLTKVPVEIIYVGVSEAASSLTSNLTALAKLSPGSVLIALVKDFAEAELAFANGAADCILIDKLTIDTAVQTAKFVTARARYMKHGGGNHLYTYSDLAAIARVLSHDIRNSLSGIMLSIEPVRQAVEGNEDAKAYVDILDRSAGKLNQVVNRFSMATGNIALKTSEQEFNELIRGTISSLPNGATKDARLQQRLTETQALLMFDKEKFPLAITNLLLNAVDAVDGHPQGEVNIDTVIENGFAVVKIQDNGHGIDYTTLQNVFRPFFTTRPGRAGLGLSLAYSIINAHGGTLRIESASGTGTLVTCTFPLKK
jgi:signal transduction histidine kinase